MSARTWYVLAANGRQILATVPNGSKHHAETVALAIARGRRGKVVLTDQAPGNARKRRATKAAPRTQRRLRSRSRRRPVKASRRMRRNPALSPALRATFEKARQTFRMWHDFDPRDVMRISGPQRMPRVLVKLGELLQVAYRSNKWTGRLENYRHSTRRPRPLLCTDAAGKGLFIVGGGMRVTERGLEG